MTNQERIKAFKMRVNGATWVQIGEELGYAYTTVKQDLTACVLSRPRVVNCIYPNLQRVITNEHGGSVRAFALAIGAPPSTLYHVLPGRGTPSPELIAAVVRGTGLTEEEAFAREESP